VNWLETKIPSPYQPVRDPQTNRQQLARSLLVNKHLLMR
jgi:hypothetical protein